MNDEGRKYANAQEQLGVNDISAVITLLEKPYLDRRIKTIKGGWRDLQLMRKLAVKLLENVLATLPTNQLQSLRRNLPHVGVAVGIKRDRSQDDYGRYMSLDELEILASASREKCLTCTKTVMEQRQCALKKVLDTLPIEGIEDSEKGCPYMFL